ncbi:MAG TPA: hypothetical protein VGC67_01350 [Cellulomonas sp.]
MTGQDDPLAVLTSPDCAARGIQTNSLFGARVAVDRAEDGPIRAEIRSTGWLLARMSINDRIVLVDRRCAPALVALWSTGPHRPVRRG